MQIDGFLRKDEQDRLRASVFAAQQQFQPPSTENDNEDYGKSMILNAPDDVVRLIVGKVRDTMLKVMATLGLPPFPVGHIECQVTTSLDAATSASTRTAGTARSMPRGS